MTCFLSSVEMTGIACIRQLFMLASKGGWEISLSSDEFYKSILERYADAALFVSVNKAHVSLDPSAVKIYSNAAVHLRAAAEQMYEYGSLCHTIIYSFGCTTCDLTWAL